MQNFMVDYGILIAQALIAVAAILAIIFPIIYTLRNPKESMKAIIGMVIFAVILLILYFTASNEVAGRFAASDYSHVTPGVMKLVTFCVTSGILFTIATFLIWVGMEIVNAFK